MNTCMECGKPAVKQEDFLVQEYSIEQEGGKYLKNKIDYPGLTRMVLCEDCIGRKYTAGSKIDGEITLPRIILLAVFLFAAAGVAAAMFPDSPIIAGFCGVAGIGATITQLSHRSSAKKQIKARESKFREAAGNGFQDVSLLDILDQSELISERAQTVVNIPRVDENWEAFEQFDAMTADDILLKRNIVCMPLAGKANGRLRTVFGLPRDETDELLYIAKMLHDGMGDQIKNAAGVATTYQKIKGKV